MTLINNPIKFKVFLTRISFVSVLLIFAGYALRGTVPYNFELVFVVIIGLFFSVYANQKTININSKLVVFSLLLLSYLMVVIAVESYHGMSGGVRKHKIDITLLIVGFVLLAWLLYQLKPSMDYFWYFLLGASFVMFIWFFMELSEYGIAGIKNSTRFGNAYGNPIKFGIYANALFILMLGGLLWAFKKGWFIFCLWSLLIAANLTFVVLSGTRTAWIGWPEAILGWGIFYGFIAFRSEWPTKVKFGIVLAPMLVLFTFFSLEPVQNVFEKRYHSAENDVVNYLNRTDPLTSLGMRFVMYEASINLISNKPLLGYSADEFELSFAKATAHVLKSRFNIDHKEFNFSHVHNQFLMSWIQYGALSVLSLLFIFVYLIRHFLIGIKSSKESDKPIFIAGFVFTIASFMGFMPESPLEFTGYAAHYFLFITLLFVFSLLVQEQTSSE
jgi:O-antigen ligase